MKSPWPTKKLGELLILNDPGIWGPPINKPGEGVFILRSTNILEDGSLDFREIAERKVENNKIKNLYLQNGDILLEKSGGGPEQPVGRVAYFIAPDDQKYIFANFIQRLRPKTDLINNRFLFFYLFFIYRNGLTQRFQSQTTGIRNLNLKLYFKIKIPLPPLEIQQKIVERLDAIKKAQELNDKQIELAEELFQSLLHRELDPKGKKWEVKKLGEITKIESGGTPSTKKTEYWNGDILWLTPKELSNFEGIEIYDTKRKITKLGLDHSSAKILPIGTVLLTSRAPIGYVAIAGKPMATNQGFKNFICDEKLLNNKFLYYFFKNKAKEIQSLGRGATFGEVNKEIVFNIKIPLPPLETQRKIVEKLSAVQEYKKKLIDQKQKLQELFESVLNKSFEGELVG